ncbi:transglycosylase domain-containing protein [Streptomyces spectabilis]|uniref:Membrane peptidoglycan carboxypeptidase n=1 Tax=Streptomyces spectabilis TaxID=68270 RepID=A0A5P2XC15_STRST|nr:transglycosylase domain-containing protein [Streptomyces spectabilis]MBB5106809.1 membrane peptidoglycan carboxypeptidase [Streptomyces spectabilis]MCI3903340.1 penicillin-binding protein [Streptomyces spectabilis]QEV60560.1 penicillin-binding protein [Streptomyces spectabilis]
MGTHTARSAKDRRRRRLIDYPRRGRRGVRRWLPSWRQWLSVFGLFGGAIGGLFGYVYAAVDIPDENAAAQQEANVYYWADGTQMVSTGDVNRQNVPLDEVPVAVRNAVIAAENASFYSDSGVSPKGLLRAVASMASGGDTQGGSTITQQYVKNTYLSQDQTVTRKVREFVISLKVDRSKSKDEILQGYLNSSWFGRGAYGIEAAAHAYYGVPARKLTPSQGAFLAALLKGAELYDPAVSPAHHRRAKARWSWILDRQVEVGRMSKAERARYRTFPEPLARSRSTSLNAHNGQAGYLVDIANKYLRQRTGLTDKDLARGGYRIRTTFDERRVRQLAAAARGVARRDLDPERRRQDRGVEIGAASVRTEDGAVLALYGGADATRHFSNNADTSGVPAGSAFKPFVLAAALQDGVDTGKGPTGMTPRRALIEGGHATYLHLGKRVGWQRMRDVAVDSGMLPASMGPKEDMFAIGTSTPSAIRLASAYGTLARGGLQHDPYSVISVTKDGEEIEGLERPPTRRALDSRVAGQVDGALRGAAADSLGPVSGTRGKPVAAGRTTDRDRLKSAWFAGYTPEVSTAVTLFRMRKGDPLLQPLSGVGGKGSRYGNALVERVWTDALRGIDLAPGTRSKVPRAGASAPAKP